MILSNFIGDREQLTRYRSSWREITHMKAALVDQYFNDSTGIANRGELNICPARHRAVVWATFGLMAHLARRMDRSMAMSPSVYCDLHVSYQSGIVRGDMLQ
jgi:hypothetical protein